LPPRRWNYNKEWGAAVEKPAHKVDVHPSTHVCTFTIVAHLIWVTAAAAPSPFTPVVTGYCWSNLLSFVSVNTFDETVLDVAFVALVYRPLPHKDDALGLQLKVNKVLGEIIIIIILFMFPILLPSPVSEPKPLSWIILCPSLLVLSCWGCCFTLLLFSAFEEFTLILIL
jgi:hypothetical protein